MSSAVLITGCSTGIGRATAERLAKNPELTVFASARNLDSIADLADTGARLVQLDTTDEPSMVKAVDAIEAEFGAVGALVNNAGYGEYGSIEEVPMDKVRREFETNVFGLSRLIQLVLPAMRAAGEGRIVNVSSMGGRLTFPMGGYYHASKYAVEAISDALRFEVAPYGIKVTLIEPGITSTEFGHVASSSLSTASNDDGSPYEALGTAVDDQMEDAYKSKLMSTGPDTVAKAIEKAVTSSRPRPRAVITPLAKVLVHTRRLLGTRVWDMNMGLQYRSHKAVDSTPDGSEAEPKVSA